MTIKLSMLNTLVGVWNNLQVWLYIRVTQQVSYKKQELLTLQQPLESLPVLGEVCVAHLFSFLCCVFFLSLCCVLCTQCFQCLWIVNSWFALQFSLMFICRGMILMWSHSSSMNYIWLHKWVIDCCLSPQQCFS